MGNKLQNFIENVQYFTIFSLPEQKKETNESVSSLFFG